MLNTVLKKLFGLTDSKNAESRPAAVRGRRLHLEPLEGRELLAISPFSLTSFSSSAISCPTATASYATSSPLQSEPPFALGQTFLLQSKPDASLTIYLDFNGHTTSNTQWNAEFTGGLPVKTPAYSLDANPAFNNQELTNIQYIWQRVSEDFLPFDVNVTTKEPTQDRLIKIGAGDKFFGIHVVIGGSSFDWFGQPAGGVAYLDSFSWNSDTPCFVFPQELGGGNEKHVAEAISHEVGHTLGLSHDGTSMEEYYPGHEGWAPIMGTGYYQEIVQWSKGEYPDANNQEDDLAIITKTISYRKDDYGNTKETAKNLTFTGTSFYSSGIIERNTDVDFFQFVISRDGLFDLSVIPGTRDTNLDVLLRLYDSSGHLIALSDPPEWCSAEFSEMELKAGTYFFSVEGTKKTGVYSDYGSLGYYEVSGHTVYLPPTSPATFASPSQTANSVALSWAAPDGVTGYVLQYQKEGASNWITAPAPVPKATTANVAGLTANTLYHFRLKSRTAAGESDWATLDATTKTTAPTIPLNFKSPSQTTDSADLSWTAPGGATGYILEYKKSNETQWTTATAPTDPTATLTGLAENTLYNFRLKATNGGGESPWATVNATTKMTPPRSPSAFASPSQTANSVALSWTAPNGVTNYVLQYQKEGASNWITAPAPVPKATTANVSGLTANTLYHFRLKTRTAAGESDWAKLDATTKATAPTIPKNFKSTAQTAHSVDLSWTAPGGTTGYVLEYKKSNETAWTTATAPTGPAATLTGLAASSLYNFRLKATNDGGDSPWATVNISTKRTPPKSPSIDLEQNVKAVTQILVRENTAAKTDSFDDALAASLTWLNEWSGFWVEIWAKPETIGRITAFSVCDFGYEYDSTLFTLDTVELGPHFIGTPNIATPGVIVISGQSGDETAAGEWVLLARVGFQPAQPTTSKPNVGVPLGQNGEVTSLPFSFALPVEMSVTTREGDASPTAGTAKLVSATTLPVYPVVYDLNDDSSINIADFTMFATAFGRPSTLNSAGSKFDFNRDGVIDIADFTMFAQAFDISRITGFSNTLLPDMSQWASANDSAFSTETLFFAGAPLETSSTSVRIATVSVSTEESTAVVNESSVASGNGTASPAAFFAGEQSTPGFAFENAFASDVAFIATCYETASDMRKTSPVLLTAVTGRSIYDLVIESLFGEEEAEGRSETGDAAWDELFSDDLAMLLTTVP